MMKEKKGIRKVLLAAACMLMLTGTLTACGRQASLDKEQGKENTMSNQNAYELISQEEAKKIMDEKEDFLLLDVRTPAEYAQGHIPGAVLVPNETIGGMLPKEITDPEQMILVYCRSGVRSRQAAEKLVKLGCSRVKDFGGIMTWKYETTK